MHLFQVQTDLCAHCSPWLWSAVVCTARGRASSEHHCYLPEHTAPYRPKAKGMSPSRGTAQWLSYTGQAWVISFPMLNYPLLGYCIVLYCFLLHTAFGIDSYLYTLWIFKLPHDWSKCQGGPTRAAKCNYPAGWNTFILNKLTGCLPQR